MAISPDLLGTDVSARWIFLYLATSSPWGLKDGHVLYRRPVERSTSGIDPPMIHTLHSRARQERRERAGEENGGDEPACGGRGGA